MTDMKVLLAERLQANEQFRELWMSDLSDVEVARRLGFWTRVRYFLLTGRW